MDDKTYQALEALSLYDVTLQILLDAYDQMNNDPRCEDDTVDMLLTLLSCYIIDKCQAIGLNDQEVEQVMEQAKGLDQIRDDMQSWSLLTQVTIAYAVMLSVTSWQWLPWDKVRAVLLDDDADSVPETEDN